MTDSKAKINIEMMLSRQNKMQNDIYHLHKTI